MISAEHDVEKFATSMQQNREVKILSDESAIACSGAALFVSCALDAIAHRGIFTVLLSGGNTPKKLYQTLASPEFVNQVHGELSIFFGAMRG